MIPLRDNIPRIRTPYVVWAIILLNAAIFLVTRTLPGQAYAQFVQLFGFVPARFTDPAWAAWMGYPQGGWSTLFSYMFLHDGWLHFLLNMWVFWIFADNLEDVLGHFRFAAFYLLCGLAALGAHVIFNLDSRLPVLGASGAIAGVMGGYFRLFPQARVLTLIPIFIFPWIIELPAVVYLGIWFLGQALSGLSDPGSHAEGVAWWAHVGGFLAGLALIKSLGGVRDCRYCYRPAERIYGFGPFNKP